MWMHFRFVLLLAVALAAGCAGSSDPKDEYIEKADAICGEALNELAKLIPEDFEGPDPAVFRKLVDARGQAVAKLRGLDPPPGDAAARRVMNEIAKSQDIFRRSAALLGKSEMAVPAVINGGLQTQKAQRLAAAYGFRYCSRL
jgi:hypothetical protein